MGQLSKRLRGVGGGGLTFWCQGCCEAHTVWHGEGPGPRWGWNGDVDKPVFTPSVLVTSGHHCRGFKVGERCWCTIAAEQPGEDWPKCQRCHTFVGCNGAQPGEITFLGDCTHALAGKTLPMADLPPFMSTEA